MAKQTEDTEYEYPTAKEVGDATATIEDMLGGKEKADEWLKRPLYDSGDVSMYDLMRTKNGITLALETAKKARNGAIHEADLSVQVLEDFKVAYDTIAKGEMRAYVIIGIDAKGESAIGISVPFTDNDNRDFLPPGALSMLGALEDAKDRILRTPEKLRQGGLDDVSAALSTDLVNMLRTSIDKLSMAFSTPAEAQKWMHVGLTELEGKTPAEAIDAGKETEVIAIIDRLAKDKAS